MNLSLGFMKWVYNIFTNVKYFVHVNVIFASALSEYVFMLIQLIKWNDDQWHVLSTNKSVFVRLYCIRKVVLYSKLENAMAYFPLK